jgi:hypothetical protein
MRSAHKIVVGKPKGKIHSKELDIDGKIILEWVLWKQSSKVWTGYIWLRTETSGGLL